MVLFTFLLALAFTGFAGIYDLKTSNVHEEVPVLMMAFGIFYWLIFSFINSDLSFVIASVSTGIVFSALAFLLYKAKVWGDGDAFILASLGFCLPSGTFQLITPFSETLPYTAYFIISLFLIGGIYSISYILLYGAFRKKIRSDFRAEFNRHRALYLGSVLGGILASFYVPFFFLMGFMPVLYTYAKVVEKGMRRKIPAKDLREDDVLADGDIKGVGAEKLEALKKKKGFVEVQDGVRFTIVFPLTLIFLYLGGFLAVLGWIL